MMADGQRHPMWHTFGVNIAPLCRELREPAGQFGKSAVLCAHAAVTIEKLAQQRDDLLEALRIMRGASRPGTLVIDACRIADAAIARTVGSGLRNTEIRRLFNCCTNHTPPEFSAFQHLEIRGCRNDGPMLSKDGVPIDGTHIVTVHDDDEAEFFTVYGRKLDGDAEAITDCPTRADAVKAADDMARGYGAPRLLAEGR